MAEAGNASIHLDLAGKHALVTGASSGLGAGAAALLGRAGAVTTLVGRSADRLAATADAIRASGRKATEVIEDVSAPGAPQRIADAAVEAHGPVHSLVHCAGVFYGGEVLDTATEQFDEQFATNVRAPFLLTQAVVPHMPEGSSIVFVGSSLAHHGGAGMSAYAASKGAIEVLARLLAAELGPRRIRVNTVSPGPTRTPMISAITDAPEIEAAVVGATPVGRLGEVDDIATAIAYLASSAASGYVSGATLVMDGGTVAA